MNRRNDMIIGGMKMVSPPCVRPAETPMLVLILSYIVKLYVVILSEVIRAEAETKLLKP